MILVRHRLWSVCVLIVGCDSVDISVGELRCEGTHCKKPEHGSVWPGSMPRELTPDSALETKTRLLWRTKADNCGERPCGGIVPARNGARWIVQADGSITVARLFSEVLVHGMLWPPPDDEPQADLDRAVQTSRRGILLTHYDAQGKLQWDKRVLTQEAPDFPSNGSNELVFEIARDADDQPLLAISETGAKPGLTVYRVTAEAELEPILYDAQGCQPDAVARVGDDLVVAGYHKGNAELARYRSDGHVQFRQSILFTPAKFYEPYQTPLLVAGIRLTLSHDERAFLVVPEPGGGYHTVEVDATGEVLWDAVHQVYKMRDGYNAGLVLDSQNHVVFGAGSYTLVRCPVEGCTLDAERTAVTRVREAYYEPKLFGIAIDEQDRVYVLTQDGQRSAYRLLIDRLSQDLSMLETFVVELAEPVEGIQDIILGPNGDIYYWSLTELGRIVIPH
jgi:hypothetical protein